MNGSGLSSLSGLSPPFADTDRFPLQSIIWPNIRTVFKVGSELDACVTAAF